METAYIRYPEKPIERLLPGADAYLTPARGATYAGTGGYRGPLYDRIFSAGKQINTGGNYIRQYGPTVFQYKVDRAQLGKAEANIPQATKMPPNANLMRIVGRAMGEDESAVYMKEPLGVDLPAVYAGREKRLAGPGGPRQIFNRMI